MNDKVSKAEQELRAELREDVMRHLERDVHRAGYVVAFVAQRLPLAELEALVDELDRVYPERRPEPVRHDEDGWPILRPSDGTSGPEAGR